MEDTETQSEVQASKEQNPTSSMARPPGEDADMQAALSTLKAFHSAMGRGKVEETPVAEEPKSEPVKEEPKVEPKVEAAPPVDLSRYESELASLKAELAKRDDLALKAKRNPIEFLKESGISLEQVTDWLQNGDESKTAAELANKAREQELEEYRARDRKVKEEQEAQKAQEAQHEAGKRYRDEVIKPAVTADKYPVAFAVHGDELHNVLLALAIDAFRRTGSEPSIADLAKSVETKLVDVRTKLLGGATPPKKEPPAPSLRSLQSSTQVPTGTKHEESDDDEALAAAAAKIQKLRQGR